MTQGRSWTTIQTNAIELFPSSRRSDPVTSREAAERVKPGNSVLVAAIRACVQISSHPLSAFDIAMRVDSAYPHRWSEASIRTAVSRAGLVAVDTEGRSPRGSRCLRFTLGAMP